jgi:HAD superfamily hydrolase (TIGR01509 family)
MIRAVLFDMDGVLVDSESFICRAAIMMFAELGVTTTPADFHPFTGMGENRYIGGVAEKYNVNIDIEKVKARTYGIYAGLVRDKLFPLPGVHEFISRCRAKGLKLALATSADRIKMEVNLREIKLSGDVFNAIVTGLDVVNKKPAPDIYIKAAGLLGLSPTECLVAEDAVSGIKAGKSAGCRTLALTTSFDRQSLHEADWIYDSLLEADDEVLTW